MILVAEATGDGTGTWILSLLPEPKGDLIGKGGASSWAAAAAERSVNGFSGCGVSETCT
jgi:hypothetical protein